MAEKEDLYHPVLSYLIAGTYGIVNRILDGYMVANEKEYIPCQYGYVSHFSNGYASVLVGETLKPYTEDGGAVPMFDAKGGHWAVIDTEGNYAVAPSEDFANVDSDDGLDYYCGARRFSDVREDGTVDFLDVSLNDKVLETI